MERKAVVKMYNNAFNDYFDAEIHVRTVIIDILKDICNRREDKTISLNNLKDYLGDKGYCYPTMAYNGGNHSEYASTMYSEVNGFRLEDDHIIFDIDDCSMYYDSDVLTSDLTGVCDALMEYESAGYILGVSEYSADE